MRGQQERKRNLEAFKDGDVRILIATDVAARGIDVSGLPYVVNMTLPEQSENYIHRVGRVGRAERMGLAISLVAANVKEKVWWCQNKKKPPQFDRRLFDEGGNCKWQSEGKMMHEVEKRLGNLKVTPIQLPHLDLPPEIQQMLKSGGYGEMQGTDASNPEFAIHLAELVGEVRELGALEFNLQTNWLRSVYRKAQEGEGEGEMVGEMKIGAKGKHASSMFGGLNLPGEEGGPK
jgi:ATP-dependent RNA helicase DDX1